MSWREAPEVPASSGWSTAPEITEAPPGGVTQEIPAQPPAPKSPALSRRSSAWKLIGNPMAPQDFETENPEVDPVAAKESAKNLVRGGAIGSSLVMPWNMPGLLAGGAFFGAGTSRATVPRDVMADALRGAGTSLVLGKLLQGAAKGAGWLAGKAGNKVRAAMARGATQAAEDVAAPIASATGELGAAVQGGSRSVENMMRLEQAMTPEQRALYAQHQASGVVPSLQQAVAGSTLAKLPGQAAAIADKRAALQALQEAAPTAVQERTAELLSGKEAARQLKARLWRYGPPALGSIVGTVAGGPVGTAVGFLAGAGSRPMVQSMRRMINTPAVQTKLWGGVRSALGGEAIPGATSELSPKMVAMLNALRDRLLPRMRAEMTPAIADEEP